GDFEMVKLLVENGADVNKTVETETNEAHFYKHYTQINFDCFRKIDRSADVNGFTPLHYAVISGNIDIVKFLIHNGADPSIACKGFGKEKPEDLLTSKTQLSVHEKNVLKTLREDADKYIHENLKKEREYRQKNPLEDILKSRIVGQIDPIHSVSAAIRRKQSGWSDDNKPLVFLFLGSSGVGKTELAKQIAKYLHPKKKEAFIRLDLSEFQTRHEVSKFIGSPPGYVGFDEGGQLTEKLRKNPDSVVLLDEVEKAHPDVLTVMLQLFDEGRITDGRGNTVNCPKAIFVMTSNLAQREIADEAESLRSNARSRTVLPQFNQKIEKEKSQILSDESTRLSRKFVEKRIYPVLHKHFHRDEFIGRINEILFFLPFNEKELKTLTSIELEKWAERAMQRHKIKITWTNGVVDLIAKGYNKYYGARSIQNEVDRKIINELAKAHDSAVIYEGCKIVLEESRGDIRIEVNK
ncbi:Para-hydroxybenzoate--polyprenyltransferase, mitochondrial precursor (PHB:polyprenyltransferase), partial [Bonamia ostreae]